MTFRQLFHGFLPVQLLLLAVPWAHAARPDVAAASHALPMEVAAMQPGGAFVRQTRKSSLAETAGNLDHVAVHRHGLKHRGPTAAQQQQQQQDLTSETESGEVLHPLPPKGPSGPTEAEKEGAPDGEVLHPEPTKEDHLQEDAEAVEGLKGKDTPKVDVDAESAGVDNAAAGQPGSEQDVNDNQAEAQQGWESDNDKQSTAEVDHLEAAPQLGMQSLDGVPVDVVSEEEAKFDDQHVDGPNVTSAEVPSPKEMVSKELFKATGLKTKDLQDAANGVDTHIHRVDQAIDKVDGAMEKYHKSINGLAVNFGSLQKMAKDMHGEVLNEFQAREDERMCAFENAERMMRGEPNQPCHKTTLEDSGHAPTSVTSRVGDDAEVASSSSGAQSMEEPSAQISHMVSAPGVDAPETSSQGVEVMSHTDEDDVSNVSEAPQLGEQSLDGVPVDVVSEKAVAPQLGEQRLDGVNVDVVSEKAVETPSKTQGAQDIDVQAESDAESVNVTPTKMETSPVADGDAPEKMSSKETQSQTQGAQDIESDAGVGAQDGVKETPAQIAMDGPYPTVDGAAPDKMPSKEEDGKMNDAAKLVAVRKPSVE